MGRILLVGRLAVRDLRRRRIEAALLLLAVLDNRHSSALERALGATPRDVSAALAAAQVLPALAGAVLGVFPGGFALFAAVNAITGGDGDRATLPALWQLLAVVLATVLVVAALTALPARLGGRRPVTEALQAELT
ncbi:FtsX-like permease family protein [Nonomuraea turkmeniaca]|uniref:FtsX-like permease family protein n=1 Tax=Nonomuraea turkmeniaca TaxID=103838 RepID=UPI001B85D5CE|nr:FtsX-like permease family protein [Nonomuraea turkmeniaca]